MKLLRQGQQNDNTRRIAVVGTFDGVHRGHRFLIDYMLSQASQRNLEPSVITFASHPLHIINPQAIPPQLSTHKERIDLLSTCGIASCIMLDFNEELRQLTARQFMEMIHRDFGIDTLVVGFNTRFGKDCVDGYDQYRIMGAEIGVEVIQAPEFGQGISSSAIRKMLASNQLSEANSALGYRYSITGKVVTGKQLGRTIGFPTANIEPTNSEKLIPASGVYAVDVIIPDFSTPLRAMLNIGHRPTVDTQSAQQTIETHIIDYSGDLYNKTLRIEFINFLRPEQQFESLAALTAQLHRDRQAALQLQ